MVSTPLLFGLRTQRRKRSGAAPFDPASIANLVLNLNGDIATLNGSTVENWPDQSGAGNDATQETASKQPLLVANVPAFGGHDVLRFDGVNDELVILHDAALVADTGMTLFMVASVSDNGTNKGLAGKFNGTAGWFLVGELDVTDVPAFGAIGASNAIGSTQIDDGVPRVITGRITPSGGGSTELRLNGVLDGSASGFSITADPGGSVVIGQYQSGAAVFGKFDCARLLVYSRALSPAEREAVEDGLGALYGITIP